MNIALLANEVQDYINTHLKVDVHQLALAKSNFANISAAEIANQIVAKNKAEKKLPTWFKTNKIYYPPALSIEQSSSEITAQYKAQLAIGEKLIDLTGGFGVDAFYFSKVIKEITHCEINDELAEIAAHNAQYLNLKNIHFVKGDGLQYLLQHANRFDTIYIDPARRAKKGKVFLLEDCTPNILPHLDEMVTKAQRIIIKTAPLLDISAGLQVLKQVSEIHILSIKNECKELIWVLDKHFEGKTKIVAATLNHIIKTFTFFTSEQLVDVPYLKTAPHFGFIFEPDVALLKSGAFNLIAHRYQLLKLHPQSQLYFAEEIFAEFPGRIFKINHQVNATFLKKNSNITANVLVRNYPAKAEDLVKKYKIKPNQNDFLIFTKIFNSENIIFSCQIIQHY